MPRTRKHTQRQVDSYTKRMKRRLAMLTVRGWDSDEGFIADFRYPASIPLEDRDPLTEYALHAPLHWHITAIAIFRDAYGEEYREEAEGKVGQLANLFELNGTRQALGAEAADRGNPNHLVDKVYLLRPLV